jgi:hypothetical protein
LADVSHTTRLVTIRAGESMPRIAQVAGVAPIDSRELARHAPDLHLLALGASTQTKHGPEAEPEQLLARCSCWWRRAPPLDGHAAGTVGAIGHYAAADAEAGTWMVEAACRALREAGCAIAIAPMDGNTWRRYRFIVERGDEPPFFLEPDQPDAWADYFRGAGFTELASYTSALNADLAQEDPRLDAAASRVASRGVSIRPFDPDPVRAEADLRRVFKLSLASFRHNYLYTPIDEAEFLEQYRSVLPFVRPELVLLAERGPELVGFLFALPDLLRARRSRTGVTDTIIIKTVAVLPGAAHAGLGSLLVGLVQREAYARGFRRAIHALMHERNVSQNISRRYARTIRRYALFERSLAPLPLESRPEAPTLDPARSSAPQA